MLNLLIYHAGVSGVSATDILLPDLANRITSYEHTITATGGFESCRIVFSGTTDDVLFWSDQLMASLIVTGPDAQICWEGFLAGIDARIGQESRSISVESMYNRIRARYTTVNGVNGVTANSSNSDSQTRYGVKETVLSLPTTTSTGAQQLVSAQLQQSGYPNGQASAQVSSGDMGDVEITLTFAGWYQTLTWLYASNSTTSSAVTTTQVANLLTTYAATNAFLSSDTSLITASGISDTQYIAADQMTYADAIERLLKQGDSSSQRMTWGVYEYRRFAVNVWAGATPTTTTYQRAIGESVIRDSAGGIIWPWDVRPDAMYQVTDLLDPAPVATQQDAVARIYIERVTCTISGDQIGVSIEPQAFDSLDARLARLEKVQYGS